MPASRARSPSPGASCATQDGALYLIVARRSEDGSIGNAGDGALYRSTDGAEHWTRVALPAGVNGPNGLAIDPRDPARLYLAAWGRSTRDARADGGIYLSTDRGATWRRVLDRDQHVYDVTIDPRRPRVLVRRGLRIRRMAQSAIAALTWKRIPGYDFKWGHRVIADPQDRAKDLHHHLRRQRLARKCPMNTKQPLPRGRGSVWRTIPGAAFLWSPGRMAARPGLPGRPGSWSRRRSAWVRHSRRRRPWSDSRA